MDVTIVPARPGDLVFQASDAAIHDRCKTPFAGHPGGCHHFGNAWGCPPHAGTLADFTRRIATYDHHWFVLVNVPLVDTATGEPVPRSLVEHTYHEASDAVTAFTDLVLARVPGALVINGEGCTRCKKAGLGPCTCPDERCRFPDRLSYSLSVALDVHRSLANLGIDMNMDVSGVARRVAFIATRGPVDLEAIRDRA